MKSEWYKDWFNTEEYINVYKHRNEDDAENHIKLILENVELKPQAKILDMACGAGRHAIILARRNFKVTAVDLSENLISIAKENAERENLKINFTLSDIRQFETPEKFELILNLFTSFGYFETDEENYAVLQKAYNLLSSDGFFVLDFFNSKYLVDNLVECTTETLDQTQILQQRKIENSRIVKRIEIKRNNHSVEFMESVRMFTYSDLSNALIKIGFDIYKTYGDFFGSKFNEQVSPRLIFICKKC